jgi:hypothetical protein
MKKKVKWVPPHIWDERGRGEKWTKPCMHIWIIKEKKNKINKIK